ncbi:MAG: hypothetical protein AB1668_04340 [Nanoarchaeota archaeon]
MLDEKNKEESSSLVKQLIGEGKIGKPEEGREGFFLNKSIESFNLAKRILEISEDESDPLTSYMWVIGTAYYSMFFVATALLAHFNHRIKEEKGIHKLTYHALVYYFLIDDNKLQKHFIEEYKDACRETEELLQMSELKAVSMVKAFDFEAEKRKRFTYEMGEVAELNKARTSVKRASEFLTEARKIIGR